VFVYRYTPLTPPQKTKNPAPKKPPSRKRDFPKINQPNFGIGGLVKTNKKGDQNGRFNYDKKIAITWGL
jgi:hypothetical protein